MNCLVYALGSLNCLGTVYCPHLPQFDLHMGDDVGGVDTEVGEWVVEMSAAQQLVGRRQSTAACAVGRQDVRPCCTDVCELMIQTLSAFVHAHSSRIHCVFLHRQQSALSALADSRLPIPTLPIATYKVRDSRPVRKEGGSWGGVRRPPPQ